MLDACCKFERSELLVDSVAHQGAETHGITTSIEQPPDDGVIYVPDIDDLKLLNAPFTNVPGTGYVVISHVRSPFLLRAVHQDNVDRVLKDCDHF